MRFRIRYVENAREEGFRGEEGYAVEILTDEGWGLDSFYRLIPAKEGGENDFISYKLIVKIKEMLSYGFKLDLMC